jgi:hypothetical protein
LEDWIDENNPVQVIDVFVGALARKRGNLSDAGGTVWTVFSTGLGDGFNRWNSEPFPATDNQQVSQH